MFPHFQFPFIFIPLHSATPPSLSSWQLRTIRYTKLYHNQPSSSSAAAKPTNQQQQPALTLNTQNTFLTHQHTRSFISVPMCNIRSIESSSTTTIIINILRMVVVRSCSHRSRHRRHEQRTSNIIKRRKLDFPFIQTFQGFMMILILVGILLYIYPTTLSFSVAVHTPTPIYCASHLLFYLCYAFHRKTPLNSTNNIETPHQHKHTQTPFSHIAGFPWKTNRRGNIFIVILPVGKFIARRGLCRQCLQDRKFTFDGGKFSNEFSSK